VSALGGGRQAVQPGDTIHLLDDTHRLDRSRNEATISVKLTGREGKPASEGLARPARYARQLIKPSLTDKPMEGCLPLDCFVREWICYLELHGHQVRQPADRPDVLVSLNGKSRGYRWLLRCVEGDSIFLTAPCQKAVRAQARLARRAGQECFVVVKFGHPGGCAVVVPAGEAVKARRLTSGKGAIPWDC
jgi:hypothetical protein